MLWRTPVLSGMRLPVVLKFPADVRHVTEPALRELLAVAGAYFKLGIEHVLCGLWLTAEAVLRLQV